MCQTFLERILGTFKLSLTLLNKKSKCNTGIRILYYCLSSRPFETKLQLSSMSINLKREREKKAHVGTQRGPKDNLKSRVFYGCLAVYGLVLSFDPYKGIVLGVDTVTQHNSQFC